MFSASNAEVVKVAECVRDYVRDVWAANDVAFCCRIMNEVFALAGVQAQPSSFGKDGLIDASDAEVICSAFRTPQLLENYEFCRQPLGRMHYALYTTPDRAELMLSMKITDWPRIKVAYSPVSQGQDRDCEEYFEHAKLSPEYLEIPTSKGAVEALEKGEADVLFLYTPYGMRPEGLVEIVPIGMRYVYFAVRKDRPELLKKLSSAYRNWYIDNIDKYDQWGKELLGVSPPLKRIRIAAYVRGELFSLSPEGRRSGIIEDWIRSLSTITHWTPDYVYGNYDESLEDVKNGRLDLVGGLGFVANRSNSFLYPHTPIGMIRVYLWAHPSSHYEAGKPETWRGMRIGLLAGTYSARRVKQQLEQRQYDITVREYDTDSKLKEAYFSGEVDAIVDVEMPELANERALRLYTSHPMYLVSTPGKKALFDELEHALDVICDDFPKFSRMFSERHYGSHSDLSELSIRETEWLNKRVKDPSPIVIDFSPWPFPVTDDTGRAQGFPKALVDLIKRKTGLNFELSRQTGIQTAEAKFLRGDTQFWIPYPEHPDSAVYGAISVFSMPVPQNCAELYGAKDLRTEFEMYAQRDTPDELVSILHKTISGLDPAQFQEMFMAAAAGRVAEKSFFGLTEDELKYYTLIFGLVLLVLISGYATINIVLLKRQKRKAEESALIAREFAQAKTRFLAMMSHELRTPLNAVIGFAEFLAKDDCDTAQRKEYVDGILKSAMALLELINDILDLSKIESGAVNMREGECDVAKIAGELSAIFGYRVRKHGVTLEIRQTGPNFVPVVKLARQGVRHILLNIVGNAAKFTMAGRIVVEYSWKPETNSLHISVYDTGCGISPEKLDKIFNPFVQDISSRMHDAAGNEIKGSGLGLAIVKKLVDNAGGTISVESTLGKGSHFEIDFPQLEVVQQTAYVGETSRSEQGGPAICKLKTASCKVLVVDDMAMNRKILGIHLSKLDVGEVRFAENGEDAMHVMENFTPDIVLTDMWMPVMDGASLARAMRDVPRLAAIPVVVITADVDAGATYDMSLFAKVMNKPVTSKKLAEMFA